MREEVVGLTAVEASLGPDRGESGGSADTDPLPAAHRCALAGRDRPGPEQGYLAARQAESDDDGGYTAIQSTRPDTLAAALTDSPAGLAAWPVEKYRAWSDCGGDLESVFSKDTLLTVVTLYWVTATIGSSFRPYFDDDRTPPMPPVDVPAGVTLTPEDREYPREYAERSYRDLRQWTGPTWGGHFLALEGPDLLAADLRALPPRDT